MQKKYAFLFPGQGAQEPGMIKDICEAFPEAKAVVNKMTEITGVDMEKLLWQTEQTELNRSDNSQLAITAASLAIIEVLKSKNIMPAAVMGFSLGEFPALYASGVLSFEDVVKIVRERGKIMQKVCEQIACENQGKAPGMSAIVGLAPEKVMEIVSSVPQSYAANMNSVKQTVVSGTFDALTKVEELAVQNGARRALRLAVAGPFHSPLMQKAADEFEKFLEGFKFNDPKITIFSNVTGKEVKSGDEAKKSAVLHLTHSVLWTDEEALLGSLIRADSENEWKIFETGPGHVLCGLWKATEYNETWPASQINTSEAINSL